MTKTHTPVQQDHGVLRFLTCGSVDDGKSTLIGRLLFDAQAILADTLDAIKTTSSRRGLSKTDLSLLTDGLQAEREQGITIDVAYRYFSTGRRKYIIADAPGHEQYTRNMVTAASTADLAIILIDARHGVQMQTRRHAYLVNLLGIRQVVVAVNKMDLVDYDEAVFSAIQQKYLRFAANLGIESASLQFMPMSALQGDMIATRGERLAWYTGPSLMEVLENAPVGHEAHREAPFRFPVQYVCRPRDATNPQLHDYRAFMGKVASGEIAVGDGVTVLPSGAHSRVKAIEAGGEPLSVAIEDQSVAILLEDDIDISRGDMLVQGDDALAPCQQLQAMVCWFGETPLSAARTWRMQHTTRSVKAKIERIDFRLNLAMLSQEPAEQLLTNDIAQVSLKLAQPLMMEPYQANRTTGAFIIIDDSTNHTVAAGLVI